MRRRGGRLLIFPLTSCFVTRVCHACLSRHVLSRHVLSRHVLSRHVLSRHVLSRHVLSRHVLSHVLVASCFVTRVCEPHGRNFSFSQMDICMCILVLYNWSGALEIPSIFPAKLNRNVVLAQSPKYTIFILSRKNFLFMNIHFFKCLLHIMYICMRIWLLYNGVVWGLAMKY
jgi:hypothetical protein